MGLGPIGEVRGQWKFLEQFGLVGPALEMEQTDGAGLAVSRRNIAGRIVLLDCSLRERLFHDQVVPEWS